MYLIKRSLKLFSEFPQIFNLKFADQHITDYIKYKISDQSKIRIQVYKNIYNTMQGVSILIDQKSNTKQMLQCCSEALSLKAKNSMMSQATNYQLSVEYLKALISTYLKVKISWQNQ